MSNPIDLIRDCDDQDMNRADTYSIADQHQQDIPC